jgi:hypothetical protein
MPYLVNRKQLHEEIDELVGKGRITEAEANDATLRRAGAGDYRVAVDDRELIEESNETQTQLQSEFDQTQTILTNGSLRGTVKLDADQYNTIVALLQAIADNTGRIPS